MECFINQQKLTLRAKRPSLKSSQATCQVARDLCSVHYRSGEELKVVEESIRNLTGHHQVKIVNSGDAAILSVMSTLKGTVLIPDQGGWSGFAKIAHIMGLETRKIGTNMGIMVPEVLAEFLDKTPVTALFLTSFAAYTAEQPLKEIYQICDERDVLLVEDASGALEIHPKGFPRKTSTRYFSIYWKPKNGECREWWVFSTDREELVVDSKRITRALRASP